MELKVWRGPAYNKGGEAQVAGYLDSLGLDVGVGGFPPRTPLVRNGRKSSAWSASS